MADPELLTVKLPGRETQNVSEWEIDTEYLTSADGFSFTIFDQDVAKLRGLDLSPVELLLGEAQQVLGRIDVTRIGGAGTAVECMGRDYLADLVECNVDPALRVTEGMQLADAIRDATAPLGIKIVNDEADGDIRMMRVGKPVKKGKPRKHAAKKQGDYKPEPGQGVFDFVNKLVARNGCTIQPWRARDGITLSAPRYDSDPVYALRRTTDAAAASVNNLKEAVAVRDFTRFPTYAISQCYEAKRGEQAVNAAALFDVAGRYEDLFNGHAYTKLRRIPGKVHDTLDGKLYRLLVVRDEKARTIEQATHALLRAIAERLKDTLCYQATVRGHRDPETGAIWSVDTMCRVDDDLADVHEVLWVAKRTLSYSRTAGAVTKLELWRPRTFVIGEDSSP